MHIPTEYTVQTQCKKQHAKMLNLHNVCPMPDAAAVRGRYRQPPSHHWHAYVHIQIVVFMPDACPIPQCLVLTLNLKSSCIPLKETFWEMYNKMLERNCKKYYFSTTHFPKLFLITLYIPIKQSLSIFVLKQAILYYNILNFHKCSLLDFAFYMHVNVHVFNLFSKMSPLLRNVLVS